jgi:hypothetical protein
MENYIVVLFKNKTKKRIIKKFITYKRAQQFYSKLKKQSEEVLFDKIIENAEDCNFEIGLVELSSKQLFPIYLTDEMGRNVKVKLEDDNMTLVEVSVYKIEEEFFDQQTNKKITTSQFISLYLNKDGVKMISSLHNKIVLQNDDDYKLFSFKNVNESIRFIDCLSLHFFKIKRGDCLFVKDTSTAQKKYLLGILENKGYDKKMLYRKFTTYSHRE